MGPILASRVILLRMVVKLLREFLREDFSLEEFYVSIKL